MSRWALCLGIGLVLLAPASASAATRFASPSGDASAATTCPQADPCDIQTAVEHSSVVADDTIRILPGIYSLGTNTLQPSVRVTIAGEAGRFRPRIQANFTGPDTGLAIDLEHDGSVLRDLNVEWAEDFAGCCLAAVNADAHVTIQRVSIAASGTDQSIGLLLDPATTGTSLVTDSIVWNDGGSGILTGGPGAPAIATHRLVNVTAIGTGVQPGFVGAANFGNQQGSIENSVLLSVGNPNDIRLQSDATNGSSWTVSYSNFDSSDAPAGTSLTSGAGNQTGAPIFEHLTGGGHHQAPTSNSTINRGNDAAANIGATDIDGQPASGGRDIGADEWIGWSNDNFATPIQLVGSAASTEASNFGAGKELFEPFHAGNAGGASLWYRWVAPASGMTTIDVCNSTFDTLLAVYTAAVVPVASDDDGCPGTTSSTVSFNATAGTDYRIAVDGFNNGSGYRTGYITIRVQGQPVPGSGSGGGGAGAPSNQFSIGKLKKGTLIVDLAGPGVVEIADARAKTAGVGAIASAKKPRLKRSSASGGPGEVRVKLKLTKAARKLLRSRGKLKVKPRVTFTPAGGSPATQTAKRKLKR